MHGSISHANVWIIKPRMSGKKPNFAWTGKHCSACSVPCMMVPRGGWLRDSLGNTREKPKWSTGYCEVFFLQAEKIVTELGWDLWCTVAAASSLKTDYGNWKIFPSKSNDLQLPSVPTLTFSVCYPRKYQGMQRIVYTNPEESVLQSF